MQNSTEYQEKLLNCDLLNNKINKYYNKLEASLEILEKEINQVSIKDHQKIKRLQDEYNIIIEIREDLLRIINHIENNLGKLPIQALLKNHSNDKPFQKFGQTVLALLPFSEKSNELDSPSVFFINDRGVSKISSIIENSEIHTIDLQKRYN